eukprot:1505982-Rhodomonas_salina.1
MRGTSSTYTTASSPPSKAPIPTNKLGHRLFSLPPQASVAFCLFFARGGRLQGRGREADWGDGALCDRRSGRGSHYRTARVTRVTPVSVCVCGCGSVSVTVSVSVSVSMSVSVAVSVRAVREIHGPPCAVHGTQLAVPETPCALDRDTLRTMRVKSERLVCPYPPTLRVASYPICYYRYGALVLPLVPQATVSTVVLTRRYGATALFCTRSQRHCTMPCATSSRTASRGSGAAPLCSTGDHEGGCQAGHEALQ